jgi:hypothetical protein
MFFLDDLSPPISKVERITFHNIQGEDDGWVNMHYSIRKKF